VRWYDIDQPEVIETRRKLFPQRENYQMIASSVTDPAWPSPALGRSQSHMTAYPPAVTRDSRRSRPVDRREKFLSVLAAALAY
jgi:hypothetical protein